MKPIWARPARASDGGVRSCHVMAHPACSGRGEHRHHVLRRSQGGAAGDTVWACWACHEWIHRHPALAYELGYLERR